jgi:hypothetical protein
MHMHNGARREAAALAHGWPESGKNRRSVRIKQAQSSSDYGVVAAIAMGGRRGRVWSIQTRGIQFIGGSIGSARCGSFRRMELAATALLR